MILNGPRLLLTPARAWPAVVGGRSRSAVWLVAAALTAAVWPAVAVVVGHIGSAAWGHQETTMATLRAAVGFTSVAGGALVMAPALTLALLWLTHSSRGSTTPDQAGPVAMGILWPAWTAGLILGVPPLVGSGPELGEAAWTVLATVAAFRVIRSGALESLSIRRRWARHFVVRSTLAFLLMFALVALCPAMAVRAILGAASEIEPSLPDRPVLPLPPEPNW